MNNVTKRSSPILSRVRRYRSTSDTFAGFTLPTVVIVSVIMLSLMTVALQIVGATSNSLRNQYYQQLAREAAEAGSRMVEQCWASGAVIAVGVVLTPATNCEGETAVPAQSQYVIDSAIFATNQIIRSTFEARIESIGVGKSRIRTDGRVELLRNGGSMQVAYTADSVFSRILTDDEVGDRASQRFWYFGNYGGLDFGQSGNAWPIPISSGGTASEGSTVVTNKQGQLIFWTDGQDVRNRDNEIALNAAGLLGSSSAVQAVASFPLNQAETRYGIISNTTSGSSLAPHQKSRLYYSEFDTTLDSGKGGIVIGKKNIDLWTEPDNQGYASEALGAMPNHDGTGYWVYTYSREDATDSPLGDRVLGFLIGTDGTVRERTEYRLPTPPLLCGVESDVARSLYGSINFSKDYSTMLLLIGTIGCREYLSPSDPNRNYSGTAYVLETNPQTGAIHQQKAWRTSADNYGILTPRNAAYSADFSPDEQFVYVSQLQPGWLSRYDITAADPGATIETVSHTSRGTPSNNNETTFAGGQVRRAPDGRMYVAMNAHWTPAGDAKRQLICITNPDAANVGDIGYEKPCSGVMLPPGASSAYGLPQMVTVYVPQVIYY